MGCLRRLFIPILLLSVVLNLADWPYLNEILGSIPTGVVNELLGSKPADAAKDKGAALNIQSGYQLLIALQALPVMPVRWQPPPRDKISSAEARFPLHLSPSRIERPPALSSLS